MRENEEVLGPKLVFGANEMRSAAAIADEVEQALETDRGN